ncbi:hypothetical protein Rsub_04688 [Raphidocelis subcapitata]|uniref:RING-type E3 ubiquitin transferase n=1 Tax=Raphidocelis subcapitata TaxID=307507 RepID=A0A2V0NWE9_9CHLO|nr:hypothetical protein Rsub_04688 [Raphidocelis subcapitata]|eukprot:GBF91964.1 hypothetical protein Rsub_04688 [Raphidocelis subcapitata]
MSEDHCSICMDPLEWTGFGPCGHKEACSRCVARLRFVLQDKRCMYCHTAHDEVYFTRYMGDFTARPGDFESLKARVTAGEVQALPEVGGYFDDRDHYQYIKSLCSYTHPSLVESGAAPSFPSLGQLKRRVVDQVKLHFCDLCLTGRKVFISEQVLYSRRDLDRHNRTGDDAGPLAEAGFKGHPPCHFCRTRFFDSNELYTHMERSHEHCFLCRRAAPSKYVYFRDYAELDGHYQSDHHPCPHPACLERRFVVFASEGELKRHFAAEHGEEMRMSRAQRREALTVPVNLQFSSQPPQGRRGDRGAPEAAAAAAAAERPGVVIGGGAGLARGGRGGMRHSRSDPAMAAAVAASVETAGAEASRRDAPPAQQQQQQRQAQQQPVVRSVAFDASDFPAVGGAGGGVGGSGGVALGTWVAANPGAGGSGGAGPSGATSLAAEDFPELPSMSRSQKQRQRQKAKTAATTLVARMAAAAAAPRVLNRAVPAARAAGPGPGAGLPASRSSGNLVEGASSSRPPAPPPAGGSAAASDEEAEEEAFPALDGGAGPAGSEQAHPSWVPVRSRAPRPGSGRAAAASPARPAPRPADFPALGRAAAPRSAASPAPAAAAGGGAAAGLSGAVARAAAAGGVSEELKAANRALIERIKSQLDERGFARFREQSASFMRGDLGAGDYHDLAVSLGLLPLVAQLAELCPEPARREGLLAAHRAFLGSSRAHDAAALGAGWVPPEAALAAAGAAAARGSWGCGACTLVNAPGSAACEACGTPRAAAAAAARAAATATAAGGRSAAAVLAAGGGGTWPGSAGGGRPGSAGSSAAPAPPPAPSPPAPAATSWPTLDGGASGSGRGGAGPSGASAAQQGGDEDAPSPEAAAGGKGKKGKAAKQKMSLRELLESGQSAPGNAWSQPQRTAKLGAAPAVAAPKGAWGGKAGGGDKLARQLRATGLGDG